MRPIAILAWVLTMLLGAIVLLELFGESEAHELAKALESLVAIALPAIVTVVVSGQQAKPKTEATDDEHHEEEPRDHEGRDRDRDTDPTGLRPHDGQ